MISSLCKLGFIFISIFFSIIASASPILVFETYGNEQNKTLIGVDNVILNNYSYDVRFTRSNATVFANQALADSASNVLIDQVFATDDFASLGFCDGYGHSCDENSVWFGRNRSGGEIPIVAQYWGEFMLADGCSPRPGQDCKFNINASYADFYGSGNNPSHGVASAPWLISCGDCGANASVWTQRAEVPEPSNLALLMVSFAGLIFMRARQFSI